jgi:para-aminobenzoate synthetase component 1
MTQSTGHPPHVQALPVVPNVFDALQAMSDLPGVLLLESAKLDETGRFSFLMADPVEWFEIDSIAYGDDPFKEIRARFTNYNVPTVDGLPPFQGGAAGLLSYELSGAWERLPTSPYDEFEMPLLAVGIYDRVLAWDHVEDRAWILAHDVPESSTTVSPTERIAEFQQRLQRRPGGAPRQGKPTSRAPLSSLAEQFSAPGPDGLTSDFTKPGYLRAVQQVIDYIYAGDIFQANLSQRLLFPRQESSLELYQKLRTRNSAPFAAYFAHDDWRIISASPERFLRVNDGTVETRPVKGTRQRRSIPEADLFTRDELRESEKDRAENVMIVDLLRNDLSRVCEAGSIRVPKLCSVEMYETVQHLVSVVEGQLRSDMDVWDLLAATFPGGSITGAPKVRAMQVIAELEPTVRGPYCGSLFYAGFDGQLDSSILIRTFTQRRGWLQCSVGGGIVAQSDPRDEYEETLHKAEGMLRALNDVVAD